MGRARKERDFVVTLYVREKNKEKQSSQSGVTTTVSSSVTMRQRAVSFPIELLYCVFFAARVERIARRKV